MDSNNRDHESEHPVELSPNDKYIFTQCEQINILIDKREHDEARNKLILLLDFHKKNNIHYNKLVNHIIRILGLFPYIQSETSDWNDQLVYDLFKVNVGLSNPITLHREQSLILKRLLSGEDLAVSAPTSFGKSFIIDAFISLKKPNNVLIIVPTISLTDETRRRLYKKFSSEYKIITTADADLAEKNIFVFPQERAISYLEKIKTLDLFIIDEFYKASEKHDPDRAPALIKAMMRFTKIAKQRYYLAPNINEIINNPFTKGMEFIKIDFNTVFLEKHDLSKEINEDETKKHRALLEILSNTDGKTLIYAGTYKNIDKISSILLNTTTKEQTFLLSEFSKWLKTNYDPNWKLAKLLEKGVGIHNGRLHRSISQLQIKLFEEKHGITNIVSTSSIIEGVNTSAENVIIWQCKNGNKNLKDFAYKNIIGRSGRMFKHFIGKIYLLSAPPKEESNELDLTIPESLVGEIDEVEYKNILTPEQISAIITYKEEMNYLLGHETFNRLLKDGAFKSTDYMLIKDIAYDIAKSPNEWMNITYLNSSNPEEWDHFLYKIINLQPSGWGGKHSHFVSYIKVASLNWQLPIPILLKKLSKTGISIDEFFELEKLLTYKLTSLLNDVNVLLNELVPYKNTDISPFIFKTSNAFLPPVVYQLEEYGLPRMVTKKISHVLNFNFESESLKLHDTIDRLKAIQGLVGLSFLIDASLMEEYILNNFLDGVTYNQ
ncbi:DEAD/DEAH box helicase [Phytobacter diazotrophicus]|uniref:DEAD/DEAH box helicase n=1 Tax=Phytobacter diazotrophicus TaxID=395631 RepID=UPI002935726D|nr:DEAD/DEAH box helicase [Phytobacter diazotrophicus]MDV2874815.1 DEAD/DEAH box helicase [Phytobacter diazotrophicus]